MINASLTKVTYTLNLQTGSMTAEAVVFTLPNGLEVHAQATQELLEYLESVIPEEQTAPPKEAQVTPAPARQEKTEDALLDWMQLPEEVLAMHYKLALQALNVSAVLPHSKLVGLIDAIDREFTPQQWAQVGAPVEQPQSAPTTQTVVTTPSICVSVDSAGNPYAQPLGPAEPDPGEQPPVEDGPYEDDDDDGAQQF